MDHEPVDDAVLLFAAISWVPLMLAVRHVIARWAWSSEVALFPLFGMLILAFVLVRALTRPTTAEGKSAFRLSLVPVGGLLLAALSLWCCPDGHPPLGGLLWAMVGFATVPLTIVIGVRLVRAGRRGESAEFLTAHATALLFSTALATALLPIPI